MSDKLCSRRNFLKNTGRAIAATTFMSAMSRSSMSSFVGETKRPNIILIVADDMGYSDLGCYGGEIKTPVLDGLAANGLRFTQFYNVARCVPSRASLMTGLYPHQTGLGHMIRDLGEEGYRGDLNNQCVTIPEVLKGTGYKSYMVGKWHLTAHRYTFVFDGSGSKHNWPMQRGFDKFYGTIIGAGSFYDPTTLTRGNTYITPQNDPEYKAEKFYYTDAINDNAVKFICEHCTESPCSPFFMYVAHTAPHWPMHALEKDIKKYKGKYDSGYEPIRKARFERMKEMGLIDKNWPLSEQVDDWERVEHKEWEARCMEAYAAMIDRMDQGIGRIIAELKKQGQLENTLIMFLSDNGGCPENLGRQDISNWHLKSLKPMEPDELQRQNWPPMQTRDGRPVLGGPDVMPGPDGTYVSYGQNWANVSNTPFRMYKHWVHEGGIATPLIVHWPDRIKAKGQLCHTPGHVIDIMATCVDIADAKYPTTYKGNTIEPLEGVSLKPAFDNNPIERGAILWEHEGNRAVRMGKWKLVSKACNNPLIWDRTAVLPLDKWELFDMEQDRTETNDLARQYPQRAQHMAQLWQEWAKRTLVVPKPNT